MHTDEQRWLDFFHPGRRHGVSAREVWYAGAILGAMLQLVLAMCPMRAEPWCHVARRAEAFILINF